MGVGCGMSKTEECNKCASAGFPNEMIGFKKSNRINSATSKPFWDLINEDGSDHQHWDKTPQNGHIVIDATSLESANIIKSIETLTQSVNALVFALCADTELQRIEARAMVSK